MKRSCLDCGVEFEPSTPGHRRCPPHQPKHSHRSRNRDRGLQARFREEVLERDGHRCTWVDPDTGERCEETEDLRACHVIPLAAGGSYQKSNGRTRCGPHDRLTDPHAR